MSRQFDLGLVRGRDFTILGQYNTLVDLQYAHPDPEIGESYEVGTAPPYDVYVYTWLNSTNDYGWLNMGPMHGSIGPTGVAGPTGPTGPQGPQGPPGNAVIYIEDELDEHGGTIRHINGVNITYDTVTAEVLQQGYTAHNSQGELVVGTATGGGEVSPATTTTIGGIIVGSDLLVTAEGVLSVDKATAVEEDNTRPITAAAVYTEVGNIDALLQTI